MLIRIETQSRKKAKLTPYMDVMDFQLILLTGLVLPLAIWLLTGLNWKFTLWIPASYLGWMIAFKINKPSGYWNHWLNHKLRGKHWSAYSNQTIPEEFINLKKTQESKA
jgi:hypothetical protein